jgi:hypothetical protein
MAKTEPQVQQVQPARKVTPVLKVHQDRMALMEPQAHKVHQAGME